MKAVSQMSQNLRMDYPRFKTGIRGGYYDMGYNIFDTTIVFASFSNRGL